jgi:hypothetical protein
MKRDRPALTVPEKDPGDDGSDEPKEEEIFRVRIFFFRFF